jgi:site-specific recombinase XerD
LKAQTESFLDGVAPRYSKGSLRAYGLGLRRFEHYAEEVDLTSAAEVTVQTLACYHAWLENFPLSESTKNLALRSLKLFLGWAAGAGLTLYDGSSYRLRDPKSKIPEPPTVAVMQRLLELPNQQTPEGLRDLLVLELLYGLGLRRTEVCTRELVSLDLVEETLFVLGKNGDERLLPVGLQLKAVAQNYLFNARPKLFPAANETSLLLNDEGHRLPPEAVFYIVKKYSEPLGLKLSPHVLRHACATHLIEGGMKLEDVQRILGHRNIGSTKRYTQISQTEMDREFRRTHPRSQRD